MGLLATFSPKKIKHYFVKATAMPPHVFAAKAWRALARELKNPLLKARDRTLGTTPSDRDFLSNWLVKDTGLSDKEALAAHFTNRPSPAFFPDPSCKKNTVELAHERFADDIARTVERADRAVAHTFDLLGSGEKDLGSPIDWHTDFKTGYRWEPEKHFTDIEIPYGKGDIKVPWELSRFQHATALGQAYWLTGDERFPRAFVSQVEHWLEDNPPRFGANWLCPMDIAIRACNWIAGLYLFKGSPELKPDFVFSVIKSLAVHGRHIRGNLEYNEQLTSNHYLSDIVGLVCIGTVFPEIRDAEEWKAFGIRELCAEMQKQVYPDGCDFEGSTCYHRLVLELFFYATLCVVINDKDFNGSNHADVARLVFGAQYMERLHRMFEATLYLTKPNGTISQLGDNDSGRHHIFSESNPLDMRYLLGLGAVFFEEQRFRVREFGGRPDILWVFGPEGLRVWDALGDTVLQSIGSHGFADAGWYVFRSNSDHLLISCGPNGQNGNGGHCHNDKLSFELCVGGRDVIVDPGTYVYTPEPDERNTFRSTGYHNTVQVNGLEQNRFPDSPHALFAMNNDANATVLAFTASPAIDLFEGKHEGFTKQGVLHKRAFSFDKENRIIEITDTVKGDTHDSKARFHLAPGVEAELSSPGVFELPGCRLELEGFSDIEMGDYWYSPEYGKKIQARRITVSFEGELRTRIIINPELESA